MVNTSPYMTQLFLLTSAVPEALWYSGWRLAVCLAVCCLKIVVILQCRCVGISECTYARTTSRVISSNNSCRGIICLLKPLTPVVIDTTYLRGEAPGLGQSWDIELFLIPVSDECVRGIRTLIGTCAPPKLLAGVCVCVCVCVCVHVWYVCVCVYVCVFELNRFCSTVHKGVSCGVCSS